MTVRPPDDDIAELTARLRQVDDLFGKGLLPADEADATRRQLRKRLLQAVVPDQPAPRLRWRARLGALGAMLVLVVGVSIYLLSGQAGLRRQSLEAIEAGRAARAQRQVEQGEAFAQLRAAKERNAPPAPAVASASRAALPSASGAVDAPLLAGLVELAPAWQGSAQPGDALFIIVRAPDDPTGLPLAALRRNVADLPLAFALQPTDLVGDPARYRQAREVVVTARISKTGSGASRPGDLVGTREHVAPGSAGVTVVIDRKLP